MGVLRQECIGVHFQKKKKKKLSGPTGGKILQEMSL